MAKIVSDAIANRENHPGHEDGEVAFVLMPLFPQQTIHGGSQIRNSNRHRWRVRWLVRPVSRAADYERFKYLVKSKINDFVIDAVG